MGAMIYALAVLAIVLDAIYTKHGSHWDYIRRKNEKENWVCK